jgi:hypothetical protein
MIEEGALIDALRGEADQFAISAEATDRILDAARDAGPRPRSLHAPTFIREGRGRGLLVAAALVLVVGGISLPLLRSEGGATKYGSVLHVAKALSPNLGVGGSGISSIGVTSPAAQTPGRPSGSVALSATSTSTAATGQSSKIESSGSVALTVAKGKIESAFSKLTDLASRDGGSVVSSKAHVGTKASGKFSYGTIVLQVPQRTFAALVGQVQGVGHATSVATTSTDVTSQYVDLRARITALDVSRQQYLAIMTRATTIGAILAVQNQLDALQSQIEQLQGQMNVLNHRTTYGTLTVSLTEAGNRSSVPHRSSGIARAWHDAVSGFVTGFEWLIRISGPVLFAVLFLGALVALGRFGWRAARRRRI